MSTDITGLVETSLNLGVAILSKEKLSLRYSVRSSVQTAKESILMKMEALVGYFGGNIVRTGEYPAWEYKKDSKLREDMIRIFKHQAIHAGLECGILSGKLEGLDCISFGPNISDIHTTEEKLSISSTKRVWEYILEVLKCKQGTKSKE
jgi:dipeptidase D